MPLTSVLLVDDSADKLVALEAVLSGLSVDVVKARSGREALRRLLERDFAVILLDVRMPDLDGFETAALIRQRVRSEHTPIIFITAFADEMHVSRGYSLKAVDYILTPVVPEVLRTKVAVFVDLFRMTAQVKQQAASLERRADQLRGLAAASLAVNSALSLDRMLTVVAESARNLLGVERAVAVVRFDERREHRAVAGVADDGTAPRLRTAPLRGRDGRSLGAIEVVQRPDADFTPEDHDVLVQLSQTTSVAIENTLFAEAREANRLKDEFLATVSHELRTPLSALLSWAAVLRRCGADAAATTRALDAIERNATAQARIVDDLLDVSRIVAGKLKLNTAAVRLEGVLESALESTLAAAEAKGIQVATAIRPVAGRVVGDAIRLQQVVSNLLSNAVKFTPRGGRIEVSLHQAASEAVIEVRDTGRGIAAAFLPHVFDPFRQGDASATRSTGGLGLGLAIVRQLVELHGGRIEARSAGEGRGATFVVYLPAGREESAVPSRTDDGESRGSQPDLHGVRILLVEDEPDTREALGLLLSHAGAVVSAAATGSEALEALPDARPDVMVCDIGLPGEDGYALLRKVRVLGPEAGGLTPAIALTAYARDADRARALAAGFEAHLAKPIEPAELFRTVIASVRGAGSRGVGRGDGGAPAAEGEAVAIQARGAS
jgi:signal transduction histidine kinase